MKISGDARPKWGFYFGVDDIDAAVGRVQEGGGTIRFGPSEVPGGVFVISATDPQGAEFGLVGARIS